MGGFQVMEWLAIYPDFTRKSVIIGATPRTTAHCIALWETLRQAIYLDPNFRKGNYYDKKSPRAGMALGTMIGLLIWMSKQTFDQKFGLKLINSLKQPNYTHLPEFEVQAFMEKIRNDQSSTFDPNSLIYLTKAMDYFNLERSYGSLYNAFKDVNTKLLLVSYESDWRYPYKDMCEIEYIFKKLNQDVKHFCLKSSFGHGAFIYDFNNGLTDILKSFLNST
jgi:homoserine O-acetyltransferase/O-succinyltransferase